LANGCGHLLLFDSLTSSTQHTGNVPAVQGLCGNFSIARQTVQRLPGREGQIASFDFDF